MGLTIKNRDFTMKDDGKMWVQALYTWPLNAHFLAAIEYWWIISWNVILQSLSKDDYSQECYNDGNGPIVYQYLPYLSKKLLRFFGNMRVLSL